MTVPSEDTRHRLFFAVELPEDVRSRLALLARESWAARWVPPHKLHLTLRFCGSVSAATRAALIEGTRTLPTGPCRFELGMPGIFPPTGRPRVFWLGARPDEGLRRLQRGMERLAVTAGLPPESRPWHPHVTLARLRGRAPDWLDDARSAVRSLGHWDIPVESAVLMESRQGRYDAIARIRFDRG